MNNEYEGVRRVVYGDGSHEFDGATFVPVCPKCGRFVKADRAITVDGHHGHFDRPNATCSKCGRVIMPSEGYV